MRPRITALSLGIVASLALAAVPASAAGGAPVRIVLDVNFDDGTETFTATGAFCPAGTAESSEARTTGRGATVFHLSKTFTCSDGTGTLTIDLSAAFVWVRGGTVGSWRAVDGTGAYAGARGGGQITGQGTPTGIIDTYAGVLAS
ncbi:MAG TPA: hypothetical protein VES19_12960 [Candidatus Limnocylindrales bacterium]|nr:hypothetical protein [Candidatus Limnocylindrales bacterium]